MIDSPRPYNKIDDNRLNNLTKKIIAASILSCISLITPKDAFADPKGKLQNNPPIELVTTKPDIFPGFIRLKVTYKENGTNNIIVIAEGSDKNIVQFFNSYSLKDMNYEVLGEEYSNIVLSHPLLKYEFVGYTGSVQWENNKENTYYVDLFRRHVVDPVIEEIAVDKITPDPSRKSVSKGNG